MPARIRYHGIATKTLTGSDETAVVILLCRSSSDKTGIVHTYQLPSLNHVSATDASVYYRMLLLCTYVQLYRRGYIADDTVITTQVGGVFNLRHVIMQITTLVSKVLYTDLPVDNTYRGPFCCIFAGEDALMLIGKRVKRIFIRPHQTTHEQLVKVLGNSIDLRIGGTVRAINALAHQFALAPAPDEQLCESCGITMPPCDERTIPSDYCSDNHRERDRKYYPDSTCPYPDEIHNVRAYAACSAGLVARVLQSERDATRTDALKDIMAQLLKVHMHDEWPPDQRGMTMMRAAAEGPGKCLHEDDLFMESYDHFYDAVERLCNAIDVGTHEIVIKRMRFPVADLVSTQK